MIEQPVPTITPELAENLAREGAELRAEMHERVREMWRISVEQRKERAR